MASMHTLTIDEMEYIMIAALSALALVIGAFLEMRRANRHEADDRRHKQQNEQDIKSLEERVRNLEIEFAREQGRREMEGSEGE